MVLILLLLPVLILLLLPLRIQLDMCHGQRRVMQLRAGVGKLQQAWLIEVAHTTQGREVSVISQAGRIRQLHPGPQQGQQAIAWLRRFRHCRSARRFLLAHVHPLQLDAQLMLHTASAASTALATGAVRACISSLPPHWLRMARLRVLPDFLNDRSTLQARCIFLLRPGTLLVTAGLMLAQAAAQAINREAQRLWNTPSEN